MLPGSSSHFPSHPAAAARGLGVLGDYVLLAELGRGGMGVVYRARHRVTGRDVALKVLSAGNTASQNQRQRLYLEARAAARLRHKNVVAVHDVGEHEGVTYLVMDLIEGESLQEVLNRDGRLQPRTAAGIVSQLANALSCAHQSAIVHRDVKPANVLLSAAGVPFLMDFGLAKVLDSTAAGLTKSGQILGTPHYMAPEQAGGLAADWRADVYALGATLYALLTGGPPFEGSSTIELLVAVVDREPVPPSRLCANLPADLETICLRCLEKEPSERYPSAHELHADLERFLADQPIHARPQNSRDWLRKWIRRNQAPVVVGTCVAALALAAVAILSVAFVVRIRGERDAAVASRAEAERQAERADAEAASARQREAVAREALDALVFQVQSRLQHVPGEAAREAREALLEAAQHGLERLGPATALSEDSSTSLALEAQLQSADLLRTTGRVGEAVALYERVLAAAREQLTQAPNTASERTLAQALAGVGAVRLRQRRLEDATEAYREALAITRRHADAGDAESAAELPLALVRAAQVEWRLDRVGPAWRGMDEAQERLHHPQEGEALFLPRLGALLDVGLFRLDVSGPSAALPLLEGALREIDARAKQSPRPREQVLAVRARAALGRALLTAGDFARAQPVLGSAIQQVSALTSADLEQRDASLLLVDVLHAEAQLGEGVGQPEAALGRLQQAAQLVRLVQQQDANDLELSRTLALTLQRMGRCQRLLGAFDDAIETLEQARRLLDDLATQTVDDRELQRDRAAGWELLGDAHQYRPERHNARARVCFEEALELLRPLVESTPEAIHARRDLRHPLVKLGRSYELEGDLARAVPLWVEAAENHRVLSARAPRYSREADQLTGIAKQGERVLALLNGAEPDSTSEHLALANALAKTDAGLERSLEHFERALADPRLRADRRRSPLYFAARAAARLSLRPGAGGERARGLGLEWLAEDLRSARSFLRTQEAKLGRVAPAQRTAVRNSIRSAKLHLQQVSGDPLLEPLLTDPGVRALLRGE